MKNIIYASLFMFLACKVTSNNADAQNFDLKTISKGSLFGNGSEKIEKSSFVIRNQKDWDRLQKKMNTTNNISSTFKEVPVDFENEMVLCVFDQLRTTGGYSIEIGEITKDKKILKVIVGLSKPNPTDMVTTVLTQPYHLVKTQKSNKKVVFETIE